MNLLFWGLTIGTMGKVLVAGAVLKVHHVMAKEHRIDRRVIRSFTTEIIITSIGIILIISGYLMEVWFYQSLNMLTCEPSECTASI